MARVKFRFLKGDVNWSVHGGTWISQKIEDYWLVKEFVNTEEEHEDYKYECVLYQVYESEFKAFWIKDALSYIGALDSEEKITDEVKAEAVIAYYGHHYEQNSWQGNNIKHLIQECHAEANLIAGYEPKPKEESIIPTPKQGDMVLGGNADKPKLGAMVLGSVHRWDRIWKDEGYEVRLRFSRKEGEGVHARNYLEYQLRFNGELIFTGKDYSPSPLEKELFDDRSVGHLLDYFSVEPGDVDDDYFKNYTQEQLRFVQEHCEEIRYLAEQLIGDDQ